MPHVNVYVEAGEILDDLSDEELREELVRRARRKGNDSNYAADYRIPQKVAKFTLDDASDILRKQGRIDLAYKLDEIKEDFVGH